MKFSNELFIYAIVLFLGSIFYGKINDHALYLVVEWFLILVAIIAVTRIVLFFKKSRKGEKKK